ncbi:CPBP family intramembrane metalloprotease [Cytobacillus sp. Sa5YUA1]|uniref:CPBP family intramembrane metalloprotease n=1 Tax=Cytobacillus stercorigallinarum TaxID=2762240 RepID=A0ABR8QUF0_9BACI|nr:CPBP family intramembrane glutamic endopeptidase [Cytobacillus stercorigallinarum]MBD7939167.1 CPBP family intramembrane metalloprotease [Cytobacillus stercorigallinarum]
MEIGFWIILITLLLYDPMIGYLDFQKFIKDVRIKEHARLKYYYKIIYGSWLPIIFILGLVLLTELSLGQIGFTSLKLNTSVLGTVFSYIILTLGVLYLCLVLYYIFGYYLSSKIRRELSIKKAREMENYEFTPILPVNDKEKKVWNFVSLSAGITEEVLYRGFLIFALSYLFPNLSIWGVIIVATFIFGLAHTYQGFWIGVVRTSIVGFLFSSLYIVLGSIIPLIVLHFLIDYLAKLGDHQS